MGSVKLIIVLFLSSMLTIEGKAISKRYVEHLLREGYTSDCGESAHIQPTSLPTIIAARAAYSPISYAEPTPISYADSGPIPYAEPASISYAEQTPISYVESAPTPCAEPTLVSYAEPAPISYEEPAPILYEEPAPITLAEPTPITLAEPTPIPCADPLPISYAEPLEIVPEHKPSAAFGYEFTVPIPPTPVLPPTPMLPPPTPMLPPLPTPLEFPASAAAITTDCNDIPTLPLAPPPAELPLPSPEELPPTHHEGAGIITEPLKSGEDWGVEVAAAPEEMPFKLAYEGAALTGAEHDEGCYGTYAAPYLYDAPQTDLTYQPSHHHWEQEGELNAQGKVFAPTDFVYGDGKSLPLVLDGYEKKALAGFRYGTPTKMMMMPTHWNLRTGYSHPWLSTGLEGYQGKIITPQHGLTHLPMYRTGVSHPFLSAKTK